MPEDEHIKNKIPELKTDRLLLRQLKIADVFGSAGRDNR